MSASSGEPSLQDDPKGSHATVFTPSVIIGIALGAAGLIIGLFTLLACCYLRRMRRARRTVLQKPRFEIEKDESRINLVHSRPIESQMPNHPDPVQLSSAMHSTQQKSDGLPPFPPGLPQSIPPPSRFSHASTVSDVSKAGQHIPPSFLFLPTPSLPHQTPAPVSGYILPPRSHPPHTLPSIPVAATRNTGLSPIPEELSRPGPPPLTRRSSKRPTLVRTRPVSIDTASIYSAASAPGDAHEMLLLVQPFAPKDRMPSSAPAWMTEMPLAPIKRGPRHPDLKHGDLVPLDTLSTTKPSKLAKGQTKTPAPAPFLSRKIGQSPQTVTPFQDAEYKPPRSSAIGMVVMYPDSLPGTPKQRGIGF